VKKIFALILMLGLVTIINGCQAHLPTNPIDIVSRENGSGTRTAFEELLDVNTGTHNLMTVNAGIKDGNGLVATYVGGNEAAIGYVSFATLQANPRMIQGLSIDGVEPTSENVLNGTYTIARPFILVYKEDFLTDIEAAFIDFLGSTQGLQALEAADTIVDFTDAQDFDATKYGDLRGTMRLGGSTSTEQAVKGAASLFTAMFPSVSFSYDSTGSGTGIKNAQDGTYTLGFASREITASELTSGLEEMLFCKDGIVFIVHPKNTISNLTTEQIRAIYMGHLESWDDVETHD